MAPPIMPGWNQFPVRVALSQHLGLPGHGRQRRQHHGAGRDARGLARPVDDFLFVKIGTGIGCGIVVDGEVYRGVSGSAGDIGHIQVDDEGPVCSCGNVGCLEAYFGGAALARDATEAARAGRSPSSPSGSPQRARSPPTTSRPRRPAATPSRCELVRDGGRRLGEVLAGLVSFFNPGLVVLGGEVVAGLGHVLLAEMRSVVYRRSLPLATGNLPIVLSELGAAAGVIGAARIICDPVFTLGPMS